MSASTGSSTRTTARPPQAALAVSLLQLLPLKPPLPRLLRTRLPRRGPFRSNPNVRQKNPKRRALLRPLPPSRIFPPRKRWPSRPPPTSTPPHVRLSAFPCPAQTLTQFSAIRACDALVSWISDLVVSLLNLNRRKKFRKAFLPSCTCPFFRRCASI